MRSDRVKKSKLCSSWLVWSLLTSTITAFAINRFLSGRIEVRDPKLPTITLPYGIYQAQKYDAKNDLFVFKNIRFGQPPVGDLRWSKPVEPAANSSIQRSDYGPACTQDVPVLLFLPIGFLSNALSSVAAYFNLGRFAASADEVAEDCLFLDVFVPAQALQPGAKKLPIVNWIYGGAWLMGSKEGRYDGTPVVRASGGNVIYVAGNYRLGSFGFLGGSTIAKDATSNAGLWDQRAVLEWIQKYIDLFGGDKDSVSLWGESAGAGSIVHHLTAFGGQKEALFKRAVIQSPAYDPYADSKGLVEGQFHEYSKLAGCGIGTGALACLRKADIDKLRKAQRDYSSQVAGQKPGWGPTVDGDFVQHLPVVEMSAGKFAKGIESIISSHVADEAALFVPSDSSPKVFDAILEASFNSSPSTMDNIRKHYAPISDDRARLKAMNGHATFTCSNRWIAEYFPGKTYSVEYGRGSGYHATDILADFYTDEGYSINNILTASDRGFGEFAKKFQAYLISHARAGDPNKFRNVATPDWPTVKVGDILENVMNATDTGFELGRDLATQAKDCNMWKEVLLKYSETVSSS